MFARNQAGAKRPIGCIENADSQTYQNPAYVHHGHSRRGNHDGGAERGKDAAGGDERFSAEFIRQPASGQSGCQNRHAHNHHQECRGARRGAALQFGEAFLNEVKQKAGQVVRRDQKSQAVDDPPGERRLLSSCGAQADAHGENHPDRNGDKHADRADHAGHQQAGKPGQRARQGHQAFDGLTSQQNDAGKHGGHRRQAPDCWPVHRRGGFFLRGFADEHSQDGTDNQRGNDSNNCRPVVAGFDHSGDKKGHKDERERQFEERFET